jgi:hypothetical protein
MNGEFVFLKYKKNNLQNSSFIHHFYIKIIKNYSIRSGFFVCSKIMLFRRGEEERRDARV